MGVLSIDAIKSATDCKMEKVAVPEWGGDIYLKTVSGTDRDMFEDGYEQMRMKKFRARFLVLSICDESGKRIFSDDQVDVLSEKSSVVLNRLFEKAWALNAFRQEDIDALGNDSPSDPSDASISS